MKINIDSRSLSNQVEKVDSSVAAIDTIRAQFYEITSEKLHIIVKTFRVVKIHSQITGFLVTC